MSARTKRVMPAQAARFTPKACNSTLSPVACAYPEREWGLYAKGPFVSTTDTSIAATCTDRCPFKTSGCYIPAGLTKARAARLDLAAVGLTADQVIAQEVELIDLAFGSGRIPRDGGHRGRDGRDLRLHVGGDAGTTRGARLLAGAAARWAARGGGRAWTFTHLWRDIPRAAWGPISVLASVESHDDIEVARKAGYAAAIVVPELTSKKPFSLPGSTFKIMPCPAEKAGKTCVTCRLCLDADKLIASDLAIAFEAHGPTKRVVVEKLVQLRGRATSATSVMDGQVSRG